MRIECTYELIREEKHRLQGELAVTEVEEVLEGRPEKVEDHCVVVALRAEPADEGNSHTSSKGLVNLGLVFELRVLGLDRLQLDGNLLS